MAQAKSRQNKKTEAIELFKRVLELNPKDYEANFEIAALFELSEQKNALVYYETGVKVLQQEIDGRKKDKANLSEEDYVPPDLYNNIGVLRLEVGKVAEAEESFKKAIKNCSALLALKKDDFRIKAIRITSKFNLAYWYEQHN